MNLPSAHPWKKSCGRPCSRMLIKFNSECHVLSLWQSSSRTVNSITPLQKVCEHWVGPVRGWRSQRDEGRGTTFSHSWRFRRHVYIFLLTQLPSFLRPRWRNLQDLSQTHYSFRQIFVATRNSSRVEEHPFDCLLYTSDAADE